MKHLVRYIKITAVAFVLAFVFVLNPGVVSAAPQYTGQIDEFNIPTAGMDITGNGDFTSGPAGVTAGPDGNIWFTEQYIGKIGRITPSGVFTEFDLPGVNPYPTSIVAGPDDNLWFTQANRNKIGRITPSGVLTEFDVPTADSGTNDITVGPDGNLWFTQSNANKIGRITLSGVVTEFNALIGPVSGPVGIVTGPDGNLWFSEVQGNKIGRITPSGVITEFNVPTAGVDMGTGPTSGPAGITAGQDGNLWFTEIYGNKIGRITPSGVITEFSLPAGGTDVTGEGDFTTLPQLITAGPDGNLWFTETATNKIGRITPSGVITEFNVPTAGVDFGTGPSSGPAAISVGPDGNLWFTETYSNKIAVLRFADDGDDNEEEPVAPTITVNGNKPIEDKPTIPKRPAFTGVATPGAEVTVTVHSDPVSCSAIADGSGNWSCTLPSNLAPGTHTVYAVITNPDNSVQNLGPYTVRVAGNGATITNTTPLAPDSGVHAQVDAAKLITYAVIMIGLLLGLVFTTRYRNHTSKK